MAKAKAEPTNADYAKLLTPLLAGTPMPIFPAGKTGDPQRKLMVEDGYVELLPLRIEKIASVSNPRNGGVPKTTMKTVKFQDLKLTAKGRDFVLREVGGRDVLEKVLEMLQTMAKAIASQISELQSRVSDLHTSLGQIKELEQIVTQAITRPLTVKIEGKGGATAPDIEFDLIEYVKAFYARTGNYCPFNDLCKHLKVIHPTLTTGHFHDTLRRLHEEKLVRVSAWTRSIHELEDSEYAFMISNRTMYYANVPA